MKDKTEWCSKCVHDDHGTEREIKGSLEYTVDEW